MFEKVNPSHPDKIADRIAGAIVDYAYTQELNPRIAVEVLIGHKVCTIIAETSAHIPIDFIQATVKRIAQVDVAVNYVEVPQDSHLADNQSGEIRCGDNGIFKGAPVTEEQSHLSKFVKNLYKEFPYDGKFIESYNSLYICQSNATDEQIKKACSYDDFFNEIENKKINPLGYWTGGIDVDSGATNRKLGSDMGNSVTGGGLHGKDLSKADVSVNIYAFLKAQRTEEPVYLKCSIGDETVDGKPYHEIVEIARQYLIGIGGFEKFAEWGLIR